MSATKPSIPPQSPISQAIENLKAIEGRLRIYTHPVMEAVLIECICHTLGSVLTHLDERITALEHFDANRVYVDRLEAMMTDSVIIVPPGFADLESLIKTACPKCGGQYEVTKRANRFYARCVSPRCEMHGALIAVSRKLAQAWEDLAQAEDRAYAEGEERAK